MEKRRAVLQIGYETVLANQILAARVINVRILLGSGTRVYDDLGYSVHTEYPCEYLNHARKSCWPAGV